MKKQDKQPKEEKNNVTVEQVAQRMQILQHEIKVRQQEYSQLHEAWLKAMTEKKKED